MAQVVIPNQKPPINGAGAGVTISADGFYAFWLLTRALLASGWKYKASGDGTSGGTKDTSGSILTEKWGVGGGVQLNTSLQSGTGPNITANTDGTATVTFGAASFTAGSVGHFLVIAGCTNTSVSPQPNSGNNGTFRIVTFTSATSIKIFNPGAVTENTATATWNEKHGAGNGTISTAGTGGATTARAIFTISAGTPFVSPTTSPVNRGSVGDRLTITGATISANNGTFMITRVISSTSVEIDNPAATSVGETNNGTLSWTEMSPTTQTYPAGTVAISSSTNASPIVVTMSANHNFLTGDTIIIANHTTNTNANGKWQIFVTSPTAFQLVGSTGNGSGGATGTAMNLTTSSGMQLGAWENLQGPSMMKIPIGTNTPTGSFLRGERVTATTSGATGTLQGVLVDTSGGLGYLVIEPRLNGSGSGPRGWTSGSTDTITGASSGATITSSTAAPIEYVRELVIWKNNLSNGHMWIQCVDQSGESASRFSTLATAVGVTNTVAPGGVAATFPAVGSWVLFGTANSGAAGTNSTQWHNVATPSEFGNVHILCATCIENSTEGADGSWTVLQGVPAATAEYYIATTFQRMDGAEQGDVDPYVAWAPSGNNTLFGGATVTANTSNYTPPTGGMMQAGPSGTFGGLCSGSFTMARGWRRRGFSSGDAFQLFFMGVYGNDAGTALVSQNVASPARVSNNPNLTIQIREPIWVTSTLVASTPTNGQMRKGYYRWWFVTEGGASGKLHSNGTYIQVCSQVSQGPMVVGPWDGQTPGFNGGD